MHDVCLKTKNVEASKSFYEAMDLRVLVSIHHVILLAGFARIWSDLSFTFLVSGLWRGE